MGKQKISLEGKNILITGAAGFIGHSLAVRLLSDFNNITVIGYDSMTDYNPITLKEWRIARIQGAVNYTSNKWIFIKDDIADKKAVFNVFEKYNPSIVVNLAAQAGVRYSIENPDTYISSNIIGFYNILEACRHSYDNGRKGIEHLIYASSASVYGGNTKAPFCENDIVDTPVSLYAATKKSNELLAHSYSKLYKIPSTGLRFFTVYGPAGRTDMFYFQAANCFIEKKKIRFFNYGKCMRDFTYIDDIVEGIVRIIKESPKIENDSDSVPYSIYNIGGSNPENIVNYARILHKYMVDYEIISKDLNFEKFIEYVPKQPGDLDITYASCLDLEKDYGFVPRTGISEGIEKFVKWYKEYYM